MVRACIGVKSKQAWDPMHVYHHRADAIETMHMTKPEHRAVSICTLQQIPDLVPACCISELRKVHKRRLVGTVPSPAELGEGLQCWCVRAIPVEMEMNVSNPRGLEVRLGGACVLAIAVRMLLQPCLE
jgi:hypothetical protein